MPEELDYKALGQRIKKYRMQKHYTQEKLAELANCAVSSVSHAERGTSQPSLQLLVRFCNILDITVDQLLCDSLPIAQNTLEKDVAELLNSRTLKNSVDWYFGKTYLSFSCSLRKLKLDMICKKVLN